MTYATPNQHQDEQMPSDNGFLETMFASSMMIISIFVLGFLVVMFTGCKTLASPMVQEVSINGAGNPSNSSIQGNLVAGLKF
jgi:hypothetical protein